MGICFSCQNKYRNKKWKGNLSSRMDYNKKKKEDTENQTNKLKSVDGGENENHLIQEH